MTQKRVSIRANLSIRGVTIRAYVLYKNYFSSFLKIGKNRAQKFYLNLWYFVTPLFFLHILENLIF